MKKSLFTLIIALCIGASSFAQLTGEKFIPGAGGPNDYATLTAAITALNAQGVGSGGVIFSIAANYTETFASPTAGRITVASSNNTIEFRKDPATTGANPLITAGTGTTANLDGIIVITGGDNITFDGIDLAENAINGNQTTRMEFGYAMVKRSGTAPFDGCQNTTIKNCTITLNTAPAPTNATLCYGIYSGSHTATVISALTLTAVTDALNNSKFFNNTITNVTNGIYLQGFNQGPPYTYQDNNTQIGVDGANTITNFTGNGIYCRQQKTLKIANNMINSTTATPSSLTGIIITTTPDWDVYNNTVTLAPTALFSGLMGITAQSGDAGYTCNMYNNTVQNCSNNPAATGQSFTGISNTGAAGTLNFYSNTVTNNNIPGTGSFTGMIVSGAQNAYIYGNTITNNTKTGKTGNFDCLKGGAATTGTANIYDNHVHSNFNTTSAGFNEGGTMNGIFMGPGSTVKLYKNKVYDLSTAGSSSSAVVNGIYTASGTTLHVYNNFVSDLRAPATTGASTNWANSIAGINVFGGTTVNVFYNTVYLDAASTGTNFTTSALYASSTTPVLDLRNNVLVNNSTIDFQNYFGYVLAYRRNGTNLATYSNNSNANVFYVNEGQANFSCYTYWNSDVFGGSANFFTDYQTLVAPRDAGSFLELPPFINIDPLNKPYDLHIGNTLASVCESNGLQITSPIAITDDFDGNTRSTTPDIGADEFAGLLPTVLNPTGVSTNLISTSQINILFTPNPSNNNVVILWNNTGIFSTPSGVPPSTINDPFAGGYFLYNGTNSPVNHTGLTPGTTYFYKVFSYDGSEYSTGVSASNSTNIAPPTGFSATAVSPTQINLAWTKNGYNNDVIIVTNSTNSFGQPVNGAVYTAGNTIPGGGGTVIYVGPLNAFNHTGLTPNQVTYYYKAWSYDPTSSNIYSPAGVTSSATTLCTSFAVPFTEGFEYPPLGSFGCGSIVDVNNDGYTWNTYAGSSPQVHSGSWAIRTASSSGVTMNDWYFTPGIALTGGVNYTVNFWTRVQNPSVPQNLEVKWGTSPTVGGMTSSAIYTGTGLNFTTYQLKTCDFTPTSDGVYYIGWHCNTVGSSNLYLDDISVYDPLIANWTGAVSTDWADALNWLPNSVPGSGTNVYIPGGLTNYPTIAAPASCANITIASGASLMDNGNLTVSGTANVNRNYAGGEWHLISSPISNATANMFLDLYLQNHTESTNAYTDITLTTTPLNVMQGYALWNDLAGTASFVGTLNTGNIGAANNVTRNGQGWNLVGNPYASPIDWDAASGWTKTNVDNATYRHVNNAVWASYVGGVGVNGGSRYIPSCQGFFVGVTNGFTLGTLNMTNAVRTHLTSTFFKDEVSDIVRLEVSGNGYTDETVIRFLDIATADFDGLWDAHKLFGSVDEAPAIYSTDNDMMAINSLPAANTVPVGVKAGVPGVFTITATETSEFTDVILEDLLTGAVTDLKSNSYTFSYDMNMDNRFILHFTPLAVGENPADLINIYSSNKDVYVTVPANTNGDIVVYNLMGQEVARTMIHGASNKITLNRSAYYVVKVVSNESVVTEKVFVK